MLTVFGILLMFKGATSGLLFQDPVLCRFTDSKQCYVAVGQRLHLSMPREDKFKLLRYNTNNVNLIILDYNKNINDKPTPTLTSWQFVADNKTMILSSAEKSDSGTYTLQKFNSAGKSTGTSTLQINIEARVSSVKVWYSCSLPGVMKVECSADGDDLHFTWTSDFSDQLQNGNRTIELEKNQQANITCHVENHVSLVLSSVQLRPCPEPTTRTPVAVTSMKPSKPITGTNSTVRHKETNVGNETLTTSQPSSIINSWFLKMGIIILSVVCALLIIISIIAFYIYKKTYGRRKKQETSQEGRELVYAQANHFANGNTELRSRISQAQVEDVEYAVVVPKASKKKKPKVYEDEVQYGELVFKTPAKTRHQTPKVEDDCVYSHVHHGS